MEPPVAAALIASITSIIVVVFTAFRAYRTEERARGNRAAQDVVLENLKSQLANLNAEKDARRDYEYDARRRLYEVTEPLLFQLTERAEDLSGRIIGLARSARDGNLEREAGWLSREGYYMRSTIHRLLAPVAIFQMLQDSLTFVDLKLDAEISRKYSTLRHLALALTDPFSFASCSPRPLTYDPSIPRSYRQGAPSGVLEAAGQSVIVRKEGRNDRLMRFGEFDEAYSQHGSQVNLACAPIAEILRNFHPRTHPVLWRCLVTEAVLCKYFADRPSQKTQLENPSDLALPQPWTLFSAGERARYDWRQRGELPEESGLINEPFEVATTYLKERLSGIR